MFKPSKVLNACSREAERQHGDVTRCDRPVDTKRPSAVSGAPHRERSIPMRPDIPQTHRRRGHAGRLDRPPARRRRPLSPKSADTDGAGDEEVPGTPRRVDWAALESTATARRKAGGELRRPRLRLRMSRCRPRWRLGGRQGGAASGSSGAAASVATDGADEVPGARGGDRRRRSSRREHAGPEGCSIAAWRTSKRSNPPPAGASSSLAVGAADGDPVRAMITVTAMRAGEMAEVEFTVVVEAAPSPANPDLVVESPSVDENSPIAGAAFTLSATRRCGTAGMGTPRRRRSATTGRRMRRSRRRTRRWARTRWVSCRRRERVRSRSI